ncbi:hypothetical protein HDZ31DRAFT_67058 [Schizophyllum fasciatum]
MTPSSDPKVRYEAPQAFAVSANVASSQTLFPEILRLCSDIFRRTSSLWDKAFNLRQLLSRAHPPRILPDSAQEAFRGLGEYVRCAADAMDAFLEIFTALRHAVSSDRTPLDLDLSAIYDRFHHFVGLLDRITSLEDANIQSLNRLEQYVVREFSYPPVIHFFIMRVLSREDWGDREIALTEAPALLDAVRTRVKAIAQLASELKLYADAMRGRFSATQLGRIKALPAEARRELQNLIVDASGDLGTWAIKTKMYEVMHLEARSPQAWQ